MQLLNSQSLKINSFNCENSKCSLLSYIRLCYSSYTLEFGCFRGSHHSGSLHRDTRRQPHYEEVELEARPGGNRKVPHLPQHPSRPRGHHAPLPRVQEDRPRRNHLGILQVERNAQYSNNV